MTKEEQLLEAFDVEMQGQQLLLMATLTNAQRIVNKSSGLDKEATLAKLVKVFDKRIRDLLEISNAEEG